MWAQAWSTVYGERPATNPTLRQFTQVTLAANATADGISVFSFPTSLLQGCTGVTVVAPLGEFVLVNVPDTNNTIANFDITLQGLQCVCLCVCDTLRVLRFLL